MRPSGFFSQGTVLTQNVTNLTRTFSQEFPAYTRRFSARRMTLRESLAGMIVALWLGSFLAGPRISSGTLRTADEKAAAQTITVAASGMRESATFETR